MTHSETNWRLFVLSGVFTVEECRIEQAQLAWTDYMNPAQSWHAAFWRHFPEQAQSATELAAATIDFYRRNPSSFLKISPAGTAIACGFGLQDQWQGDSLGRMTIVQRAIATPSDWERIVHHGLGSDVREYFLQSARLVLRATDSAPVLQTVFNPLTIAWQLAGPTLLRNHLESEPVLMRNVLTALSQCICELINALCDCGVHGIYLATQTSAYSCFSPTEYQDWAQPYDEQCMAAARDLPCNVFHLHGDDVYLPWPVLPPNWVAHYEWVARNPSFEQLAQISSAPIFIGAPVKLLAHRTDKQMCATLKNLSSLLHSRPAVLTPGCCLPLQFPEAYLQEWYVAVSQFSK